MSIFDFLKKKEQPNYYLPYEEEKVSLPVRKEPEFDYSPEVYAKNYPRQYPMTSYAILEDGVVFTRDVKDFMLRDMIKRVIFTDAPFPEGYRLTDVSLDQDRSILAWNQTIGDDLCLVVSTGEKGKGIQFNRACNYMFSCFTALESIEWNNVITTADTVSMRHMFDSCREMKSLDLSCFDVSNTKYMHSFLVACYKLEDIKWFPLNTGKMEMVDGMFANCHSLRSVDFRNFDTSSLTSCKDMFYKCGVKAVNLGHWMNADPNVKIKTEGMFETTGLLSVLTTDNEDVKREYMNRDEATKYCQDENDIPRKIVPVAEWKVPTYSWEKPSTPKREESMSR